MKPAGSHWQSLRSLRGGTLPKNPPTDGTAVPSGPNPPHHTAHERLSPFYPLSIGESGEGPDVRLTFGGVAVPEERRGEKPFNPIEDTTGVSDPALLTGALQSNSADEGCMASLVAAHIASRLKVVVDPETETYPPPAMKERCPMDRILTAGGGHLDGALSAKALNSISAGVDGETDMAARHIFSRLPINDDQKAKDNSPPVAKERCPMDRILTAGGEHQVNWSSPSPPLEPPQRRCPMDRTLGSSGESALQRVNYVEASLPPVTKERCPMDRIPSTGGRPMAQFAMDGYTTKPPLELHQGRSPMDRTLSSSGGSLGCNVDRIDQEITTIPRARETGCQPDGEQETIMVPMAQKTRSQPDGEQKYISQVRRRSSKALHDSCSRLRGGGSDAGDDSPLLSLSGGELSPLDEGVGSSHPEDAPSIPDASGSSNPIRSWWTIAR